MPRFSIGGIFSNERLSQIAVTQNAMMTNPTTHDSMERLDDNGFLFSCLNRIHGQPESVARIANQSVPDR